MGRHVFQSFWYGSDLPPLEQACIKSFLAHGHSFDLYSYGQVGNVPAGCRLLPAEDVVPASRVFLLKRGWSIGSPAAFSNVFRYSLLVSRGGWWIDTDFLCVSEDIPETEYAFALEEEGRFNNAPLRAPAGSPLLQDAVKRADAAVARTGGDLPWASTGPVLITQLIAHHALEAQAWRTSDFFPWNWRDAFAVFDPNRREELQALAADSIFVHLWTSLLRIGNVLKTVPPPRDSYLDAVYTTYDVAFPSRVRYEWDNMAPQAELLKEWVAFQVAFQAKQSAP